MRDPQHWFNFHTKLDKRSQRNKLFSSTMDESFEAIETDNEDTDQSELACESIEW